MPTLSRYAGTLVARKRDSVLGTYRDAYAKTDISIGTWERVEKGGSFQARTLWRVVDALGWPPAAADLLLRDQDPDGRLDPGRAPEGTDDHVIDRWVASTDEELEFILSEAGFEARAEVVNLARRILESEFYRMMMATPLVQPGVL